MKKFNAFLVSILMTAALNAAVIDQVIVRQQWPWSTDIKVEYKLMDVTCPVDIAIKAYNGDTELSLPDAAITGARYGVSDVVGTLVIDPIKAFGTAKVALANFKVKLTVSDSDPERAKPQYRIFDLETGEVTDVRPCDDMSGNRLYDHFMTAFSQVYSSFTTELPSIFAWSDVVASDNIYRTRKLILKRIPAAGVVWKMGSPTDETGRTTYETQHNVKLTKDFWIGVFPITQYQYNLLMGTKASYWTGEGWETRPADQVSYNMIRGANAVWPDANGKPSYVVDQGSFLSVLREKFGNSYRFDLPTEAQYEFATRGGNYTKENYTGLPTSTSGFCNLICRNNWNKGDGWQNLEVGYYKPNAWGLYDMVGSIYEWCLDWGDDKVDYAWTADPEIDPVGPVSSASNTRRQRGCAAMSVNFNSGAPQTRSAFRGKVSTPASKYWYIDSSQGACGIFGFRVCITEE